MRVQIIDIGNSKGIRIPQAILKQASFGDEVEMEVTEGKITLKKSIDANFVPNFEELPRLDDASIQGILRKISGVDLLTALVGADAKTKECVYRNVSPRVKQYLLPAVKRLEKGDAKDLLVERSRNIICEALMETMRD
jgi:flagellar motor switch protein FliG